MLRILIGIVSGCLGSALPFKKWHYYAIPRSDIKVTLRGPGRARHPKPLVMGKVTLSRNVTCKKWHYHVMSLLLTTSCMAMVQFSQYNTQRQNCQSLDWSGHRQLLGQLCSRGHSHSQLLISPFSQSVQSGHIEACPVREFLFLLISENQLIN